MRLPAYAVAALVVGALVPAPARGAPAVPTCRGETATVVGHGQQLLEGTAGRDVIVTGGAFEVAAGAGDDLVCITRGPTAETANVRAGRGDDEVWVVRGLPSDFTWTELGQGADTFRGGPGWEIVWAGKALLREDAGPDDARDAETDDIWTGDGADAVVVGEPGTELTDRVDTGAGGDDVTSYATGMTNDATLALGDGTDRLAFVWAADPTGRWLLDNRTGTGSLDGTQRLQWSAAESFDLPEPGPGAVSFVGSDADEVVLASGFADVDLGGGDDTFVQTTSRAPAATAPTGRLHGGEGTDTYANDDRAGIDLDLVTGRVRYAAGARLVPVDLDGVEDVRLQGGAAPVTVRGDGADNRIEVSGCRVTVDAGDGADEVLAWGTVRCTATSRAVLRGGAGDDLLVGGPTDDRLTGGAGQDDADGRGGADTCRAEVRRSCAAPA